MSVKKSNSEGSGDALEGRFSAGGQDTITRYAWENLHLPAAQFELNGYLRTVERRPDSSNPEPFRGDPIRIERAVRAFVDLVGQLARKEGDQQ